jgi:hypothetical protein
MPVVTQAKGGRREAFSHDHGTKANPRPRSAYLEAAFLWHTQLEVETDTWNSVNDGD